ncbi:MAG TPA: hypothetical protein VF156_13470 [Agromyces sp.]
MKVARPTARRRAPRWPSRRRTPLAALLGALLAIAGIGLAASPASAEELSPAPVHELVATGVDGAGGLLAAGALLVLAGALAILARRRTGPHPD